MPSTWLTVTTPVPPMPDHAARARRRRATRGSGSGIARSARPARSRFGAARRRDDRQERRAVALEAGVVLVARGLVDLRLAAELGLDRLDRQAAGLLAAVAAALADALVDAAPAAAGRRALPRLRTRRSSAAHSWSWISTVTPSTCASSCCAASSSIAVAHLGDRGRARRRRSATGPRSVTTIRATPSSAQASASSSRHAPAGPRPPGRRSSRRCRCRAACR